MKEVHPPAVTVLLPTYNRATLLPRAVKSVLSQSFTDFELIIINDASTDGTKDVIASFAQKDPRIVPVHNEHNRYPDISGILNDGLTAARGKYIARLDDDDYWCDEKKLEKQVGFLELHQDCMVVGGGTITIDENDQERFRYLKLETDEKIRDRALFSNPFTHSTVMFRKEDALAAGGYGAFKNAEDWDLWLRMGMRGTLYNFQEYFVRYLQTDKSKTFLFKRSQGREILKVVSLHKKEYPHFYSAYAVNFAQYMYSFLPLGLQRMLYGSLSRAKRGLSSRQ